MEKYSLTNPTLKELTFMKSRLYTQVLAVAFTALFVAACSSSSKDKATQLADLKEQQAKNAEAIKKLEGELAKDNPAPAVLKMKEVGVQVIAPRPFDHFVQTQGSVEAVDNILVSARTVGVISQVYVQEGAEVKTGQTLAQIDNSIVLRNIEEVKSQLELANTVYQRQKNLWDQKIGTEVAYLQAKSNKESMEKRLATLNEQLDMARIKSPIDGSVDEVSVKIGQNAAPGAPAFRVVSSDKLKMKSNLSEAFVTSIQKGNKVTISFPDINRSFEGRVTFVGKTINQLSRTFSIEAALPSSKDLRPNMTGVVRVIFQTQPSAIVVPINIVQDINDQKIVYVAVQEGEKMVARKKVVTITGVYDNMAEVATGLKANDKIIVVGFQGLNDGELIKI
jgi:membrane fusion protein (multidrug efflux system)